jgi:flagellar biosynthesis GTPase FlhF
MIRDYIQLSASSNTLNKVINPYEESKATLFGDIHRVKRYFYYVTDNLKHLSNLDRRAVDLAILEVRRSYDDDGNVLNNIHNYLRTFCLKNIVESEAAHKQQRKEWQDELDELNQSNKSNGKKMEEYSKDYESAENDVKLYKTRSENYLQRKNDIYDEADRLTEKAHKMASTQPQSNSWSELLDQARRKKSDYESELKKSQLDLDKKRYILKTKKELLLSISVKIDSAEKQIENLKGFLKLNLGEEHKKLTVKYGRGLLLYGPPGTGML